jgi:RsiW-degrading membrane proteinase PrsW (M82 family)
MSEQAQASAAVPMETGQVPQMPVEQLAQPQAEQPKRRKGGWWRVLLLGFGFFVLGVILLLLTGNPNLFPTVVMIGNFTVPAAYVAFFYERRHLSRLTMPTTMMALFYGGLLGVFAASILEPLLVRGMSIFYVLVIGLVEEFVKILGVLVIGRHRRHDSELDGLILGAAAGMGFAALESMGYAFTAFMRGGGSLSATVAITLLRGLLSPLGHGTWTAILVGVLFRESGPGGYHINWKVIGTYILVVLLHALWDAVPTVIPALVPSGVDVFIGQAAVGAAGLLVLWLLWRQGKRLQIATAGQA